MSTNMMTTGNPPITWEKLHDGNTIQTGTSPHRFKKDDRHILRLKSD